jgi:hypothetical protein
MAILKAILGGEGNPTKLARHGNSRSHATEAEIRASLRGNYRAEHLFALEQAIEF